MVRDRNETANKLRGGGGKSSYATPKGMQASSAAVGSNIGTHEVCHFQNANFS
jgi:hypothetical protein